MQITTIEEARSLVGRTFERGGQLWTVERAFRNLAVNADYVELTMTGEGVGTTWSIERFAEWISAAHEVFGTRLNDDWLHATEITDA